MSRKFCDLFSAGHRLCPLLEGPDFGFTTKDLCGCGGMVDAPVLGTGSYGVKVQVLSPAPRAFLWKANPLTT